MQNKLTKELAQKILDVSSEVIHTEEVASITIELMKLVNEDEAEKVLKLVFLLVAGVSASACSEMIKLLLGKDEIRELEKLVKENHEEQIEDELQKMIENYEE